MKKKEVTENFIIKNLSTKTVVFLIFLYIFSSILSLFFLLLFWNRLSNVSRIIALFSVFLLPYLGPIIVFFILVFSLRR